MYTSTGAAPYLWEYGYYTFHLFTAKRVNKMGEKEMWLRMCTFIYLSSLIKLSPQVKFLPRHLSPDEYFTHFAHIVCKRSLTTLNLINMMYCNDILSIRIIYFLLWSYTFFLIDLKAYLMYKGQSLLSRSSQYWTMSPCYATVWRFVRKKHPVRLILLMVTK